MNKIPSFLLDYIEGEKKTFNEEEFAYLKSLASLSSIIVYRGLSFETEADFKSLFPDFNPESKTFTYLSESPESFSLSLDQAEYFAQDIYSNFGVVFEIEISEFVDLRLIDGDFDHEKEVLHISSIAQKVKIIKIYKNTKDKLDLK